MNLKRLMDKVFLISLLLLVAFAWADSENVKGIKQIDKEWQQAGGWDENSNVWLIFWDQIQPSIFNLWVIILAMVGLIWYLISKDLSESLGIFITPVILILFGVQDLIYFAFSPDTLSSISCWADALAPVKVVSDLLGETCPTAFSFILSSLIGIIIAYYTYNWLKRQRW